MSKGYQVLARKYRPQTFSELLGQDVLVTTLKNAIEQKRIPHAILLTGVRGIGKTTTARLIARSLNCIGADGKGSETISPCGTCQHCTAILEDKHLDVIEMDAASRTSVDDIRKVIEAAHYKPSSARYKIQIIDEVHMLTKQAFNALLKTLEEPPEYTKFIFATTELHRVPDTIISRCVRFDLKRFDRDTLKELLENVCKKESVTIESEALSLLAQSANGSARDSLSLLERAISLSPGTITDASVRTMLGLTGQEDLITLLSHIMQGKSSDALTHFHTIHKNGGDPDQFLSALCDAVHEMTMLKISPDLTSRSLFSKDHVAKLQELSTDVSIPNLTRLWQVLTKGREEITHAPTASQAVEMVLIRACYLSDLPTTSSLLSQILGSQAGSIPSTVQTQETATSSQPTPQPISSPTSVIQEQSVPTPPEPANRPSSPPTQSTQGTSAQSPLVQSALDAFPDAKVGAVKPLKDAS